MTTMFRLSKCSWTSLFSVLLLIAIAAAHLADDKWNFNVLLMLAWCCCPTWLIEPVGLFGGGDLWPLATRDLLD